MEGQGENFHYGRLENNPIIEGVSNQLMSTTSQEPINGLSVLDQNRNQDYENVNSSRACDVQSNTSLYRGAPWAYWVKGHWSTEEDRKLMKLVKQYGLRKWAVIAEHMAGRIGKQCRERWHNHLRPDIKKCVVWSDEEEKMIVEAHEKFGNKWAKIAKCVPGRSENSIKNHWNATVRKQTSKRKIKPPERLRGLIQSTVLEEYIKKIYFNEVSTTSNNPKTNNDNNLTNKNCNFNNDNIYDHDSTNYLLLETFDEEMNFMEELFVNKDNPN
ncbi:hypothetical protein CASFOL_038201 [Castilleja foliolosa]|uniref:Uncharacterized protein n=1 Tax=Castilleja foliolosa TaxID=1961234 RepID=A0ABD3BKA9_9LAMI